MAGKNIEKEPENESGATEELGEEAKVALRKKAKKKLIIVLALLLLLTLVGAGIFLSGVFNKSAPEGEQPSEEGHADSPEQAKAKEGEAKKVYMNIGEFLVNLNTAGKQPSFLKMSVTMEVVGETNKKAVTDNLPRIKDAFQTYLRELRAEDLKGSAGVYRLREALLIRVNKVLYPAQVSDILFEELIVQ